MVITLFVETTSVPRRRIFAIYLGEGLEDVLGGFGPDERLRVFVPVLDPFPNVVLQGHPALVNPAADQLLGQEPEPALDLVDLGRAGRGEVQVEAGMAARARADRREPEPTESPAGERFAMLDIPVESVIAC
jgi:hypothetical protein